MPRIEKTVFISYRRTDEAWALLIYKELVKHGYDVFIDYTNIASGDFEQVILANIKARAHFVVVLTPSALERCGEPGDWLRREIETALTHKRNIVPLILAGFDFGEPAIAKQLTGQLELLKRYNALSVPTGYFEDAIERLYNKFLNVALETVVHPLPNEVIEATRAQQTAANAAKAASKKDLTALEAHFPKREQHKITEKIGKIEPLIQRQLATPSLVLKKKVLRGSSSISLDELSWQPIEGAKRYVLEESTTSTFLPSREIYEGSATTFSVLIGSRYYRVKAQGVNLVKDSEWSNVVSSTRSLNKKKSFRLSTYPPPKAELDIGTDSILSKKDNESREIGDLQVGNFDDIDNSSDIINSDDIGSRIFHSMICLILSLGTAWTTTWVGDWLLNLFGWSSIIPTPMWFLISIGVAWAAIYTWSLFESSAPSFFESIFFPYFLIFETLEFPGQMIGRLLCSFPLNFIAPYVLAQVLPYTLGWLSNYGLTLLGWTSVSIPVVPIFWVGYSVMLLWGVASYMLDVPYYIGYYSRPKWKR